MKVELDLSFGEECKCYQELFERGYIENAYKDAEMPAVFPGLSLWIPFVNKSGESNSLGFEVRGALYDFDSEVFSVDIIFCDGGLSLLGEMVTEENGWRKYTSLGNHKFSPAPT